MMAKARRSIDCPRDPIGLGAEEASAFIGVSTTTFAKAVENGLMPAPFELFGRKIWSASEIEAALNRLPRRGAGRQDDVDASDIWGDVSA
jgi:predicted DNA-binding transcriptional regulator AlpA